MTVASAYTVRRALYEGLAEALEGDEAVVLMGEDIGPYGGAFGVTQDLHERFPTQVLTTPISENSFVGAALGASMTGLRPVVEIMFMDFITLAMDQLVNHASKVRYMYDGQYSTPMVVRTAFGGGRGYGPSHSQSLESWFMSVAGLKTVCPSTPADAKALLLAAIADDGPVLFLEHKLLYGVEGERDGTGDRADGGAPPALGRAAVRRSGDDVSVIAYGWMCRAAEQLAEGLEVEGVSCEVIDLRTLKPLDTETVLASVRRTGRAVILEEGNRTGGVGAEIAALIAEECLEHLRGRVVRVGAKDVPLPAAPALEREVLPQLEDVVAACRRAFEW